MLQDAAPRSSLCSGKVLMFLAVVVGFAALLSLSPNRYEDGPAALVAMMPGRTAGTAARVYPSTLGRTSHIAMSGKKGKVKGSTSVEDDTIRNNLQGTSRFMN